jgi:hypothetical protein
MKYSHSEAMAVFYKIVKLVKKWRFDDYLYLCKGWLPSEQCSVPLDTTTSLAFANAINTRKNKDRKTFIF